MSQRERDAWIVLAPPFSGRGAAQEVFREHAQRLAAALASEDLDEDPLQRAHQDALTRAATLDQNAALHAALHILTDLGRQRWSVRVTEAGTVEVKRPDASRFDPREEKDRVRAQEVVKRDEQLRQPATRKFIKAMERGSAHGDRTVSIFSLMRDGRELASALREAREAPPDEQLSALRRAVDPYLQFVDDLEFCPHTGLRAQDIWRYFRHTWSNQYTSTPGRSMAFLVRDRARDFHPIVGIGALGSPVVQIRERDSWIGWNAEAFMEHASEAPSAELGVWLHKTVDNALSELFVEDLFEEQLIRPGELRAPTGETIERLVKYGGEQRELHHRLTRAQDLKRAPRRGEGGGTEEHWRGRALTHLYRSKRALSLADMLRSRRVLSDALGDPPTTDQVRALVQSPQGQQIVKKILRKARADRVGISMADITVCGAIPPYNPILGGKLVAMLAASPEVVSAYRRKYLAQESEIASSMAGRPIVRSSELVLLGTTSLYGVGSSQYNRLRMPAKELGGRDGEQLAYLELGRSEAYGTSQFSSDTVEALVSLVQQSSNGVRVNSIFGEGVSPKLRKIRDGLDALNLPTDALLQHGRHRIVYGIPVIRNLREFLLGMDDTPDYLFDLERPRAQTAAVATWWMRRWLARRVMSDEVLSAVAVHTLVRPVRHGARVVLPAVDSSQGSLFDGPDQ